ncbi:MAG: TolC family protein [Bacteroidaceae bacterium]|nr:TolC family protein [Bacteroidaceae bacterium]
MIFDEKRIIVSKMKGKKLLMSCWMLMVCLFSTSAQAQDNVSVGTMNLTLEKAIEIALAENPTIHVADKEIELKKIADKEAWQALLPTLDATLTLSDNILVAEMVTGMGKFKMGVDGTLTAIGSASLNLPVFAPAVYQNMKLTKQDILLAQEKARGSRLDLIRQVTKAYYSALLSSDSYEVMKKSYTVAKENFDVVNEKYKVGRVSEYDKISAEVQARNMNASMVSAKTGKSLALLQLKVLMGVTADVDFVIDDSLKAYESQLTLVDAEDFTSELDNNSSLRQLDYNMSMLERTQKLLRTNFMPTVALQLTGQYQSYANNNWNVFGYRYSPSSVFSIAVNVPIFHASSWTKIKTNKVQIAQLEDNRLNTRRQLSLAAESYKQNMASTMAQVESNAEAIRQADKAVTIAGKRYEVGRGTILELNQSETALTQAELTYVQSIYDYLTNKADLDYTLGRETYMK